MSVVQPSSIIPHIIDQHAEEAAFLWLLRDNAVTEAHYDLKHLQDLENRIEAHIDGLRIAGHEGWKRSVENLKQFKESGEMFTAATLAFESTDPEILTTLYALAEASPGTERGLISALGWVKPQHLKGKVSGLLASADPFWRRIGIAACAIHRVDPGQLLNTAIQDKDSALCCRAIKAAGELGRSDLEHLIAYYLKSDDSEVRFWSAWTLTLLGNRDEAPKVLQTFLLQNALYAFKAAQLVFRTGHADNNKYLLGALAGQQNSLRLAIQGSGISGDATYIPWLIQQMETPEQARVAGEAFSLMTGIDLAYDDLDTDQPEDFYAGPTESPEDEDTTLDPDENLPWPDVNLIQQWWQQHHSRFSTSQRYLMGEPVSEAQCKDVLKNGMQRQREAAALELALITPSAALL